MSHDRPRHHVERARKHRPVRTLVAMALIGLASAAFAAPAAQAAPARVWLQRSDPLSTDPVRLRVAAVDSDGDATPFVGQVTLAAGRTRSTVPVTSTTGQEEVEVPTTALSVGSATATAVLRVGGKTLHASVKAFADIPPTVELRGFGCGVVTPKQKRIAWQFVRLNGSPISYPAWTPSAATFAAYVRTVKPAMITDSLGQPVQTRGTVVLRKGTRMIRSIPLPNANRRLLFSVAWPGAMRPGAYIATITLTDAHDRSTTATQQLLVARSSAGLCP
jgi:hypothetical protein